MATELQDRPDVGQVRVDTGYGRITKVEPPKGRNAQVVIDAEHLKIDVTGWIDTHDRPLYEGALEAQAAGRRIFYVIECHRRGDCKKPLDTPLADLANTEKVKDVIELTVVDGDGKAIGGTTVTERPAAGAATVDERTPHEAPDAVPAPKPPTGSPAAQDASAPSCGRCGGSLAGFPAKKVDGVLVHGECPAVDPAGHLDTSTPAPHDTSSTSDASDGADQIAALVEPDDIGLHACPSPGCDAFGWKDRADLADHIRTVHPEAFAITAAADVTPPPASRTSDGKRGPRIADPKPWEPYVLLQGGASALNLGSYAVQATEGMVLLAHDLLLARARTMATLEGAPFAPPAPGKIAALARRLLRAADIVQASVRPDGRPDRMGGSHTRCRAAVRSALDAHPVPWDEPVDVVDAWVLDLARYAYTIVEVTMHLVDPADDILPLERDQAAE